MAATDAAVKLMARTEEYDADERPANKRKYKLASRYAELSLGKADATQRLLLRAETIALSPQRMAAASAEVTVSLG
ncbi:hypothetical protein [Hyphomicrobium sp. NDB2Meth4]|uniref:hypothetical protein n=1 Tax=Hyphomicrobium sp. NDB2Meth4 TaxID=1892846 RepID=UPI0011147449|nr:hypothetical protein [Hyphomicrobium sp. NDB2Meth4]